MKYHLLTGATGLLGRYLLRDFTLAGLPLAVVVRPARIEDPTQRIETIMSGWEQQLGRSLLRPVVLAGDISEEGLGLCDADVSWLSNHCDTVVHSAASLTFHADEPAGEPWLSNIGGTRHTLEICRRANIRQLHHVSTAYVCGQRRGRILESELDVGQIPGNDYEQSKITAEKEVLGAEYLDRVTVHRPSIIVGDSVTGYTSSYHGFYTPLRLVHAVTTTVPWEEIEKQDWLGGLQLAGHERKNLVPVEWVSAAMTALTMNPALHGRTYHLTNPKPTTVAQMLGAIAGALAKLAARNPVTPASNGPADETSAVEMVASFREQMKIYQTYWSDDPEFDDTHTRAALPDCRCPEITPETMQRLIDYAIDSNFGWPREPVIQARHDIRGLLNHWLAMPTPRGTNGETRYVNLRVSGSGGGQWHLAVRHGEVVGAQTGLRSDRGAICHLTSDTFSHLVQGQLTWEQAIKGGKLVVAGNSVHPYEIARLFHEMMSNHLSVQTCERA